MKCQICDGNVTERNYCRFHAKAYENVIKQYDQWKKAQEIPWKEYLSEIVKNPLTGEWAREVAEQLIKSGEKTNVKNR